MFVYILTVKGTSGLVNEVASFAIFLKTRKHLLENIKSLKATPEPKAWASRKTKNNYKIEYSETYES